MDVHGKNLPAGLYMIFGVFPYGRQTRELSLIDCETGNSSWYAMPSKIPMKVIPKTKGAGIMRGVPLRSVLSIFDQPHPSLGTDPEVFVVDENGIVIPAFRFLPPKEKAKPVTQPFWDGFQCEFRTNVKGSENRSCLAYLSDDVQKGLRAVYKAAKAYDPSARLTWKPVLDIPSDIMASAEPEHVELGCAPSFNAYPWVGSISVPTPSELPFRFAGCHLHFGISKKISRAEAEQSVRFADKIFGIASVLLFRGMEDPRRRVF